LWEWADCFVNDVTRQRCIKARKVKLCLRDQKKIGFARRYHARDAPWTTLT
jgi:hypothetical protein